MTSSEDVRFGQAAVELGHCTAAQVRECLTEQEQRRRLGERVVLGFLLVEQGYLSPDDVPAVLKQQKRREIVCLSCGKRSAATLRDTDVQCPWCGANFVPWTDRMEATRRRGLAPVPDFPKPDVPKPEAQRIARSPAPSLTVDDFARQESAQPLAVLMFTSPNTKTIEVPIYPGVSMYVGRHPQMDLQINDASLSRRHCRFYDWEGRVCVEDLQSHNGTLVDGQAIHDPTPLQIGEDLLLGDTRVVVAAPPHAAPQLESAESCTRCALPVTVQELEAGRARRIEGLLYCAQCLHGHVVPGRELGRYKAIKRVGRGGMAEVWTAHDRERGEVVALKVMLEPKRVEPQARRRFLKEAQAGARLHHPGFAEIYEQGEAEGIPFIAMEYVRGVGLAKRLDEERRIERNEAVRIALDIAHVLAHAHERQVIHRDVKPANIILDEQTGRARLLDLGVVKTIDLGAEELTRTGTGLGTLEYAPPEQIADAKRVDHRVDIYSLGATLYRMVCGHRPFSGSSPMQIAGNIVNNPVPWSQGDLKATGTALQAILNRCMAKRPEQRFASCHELVTALEVLLP